MAAAQNEKWQLQDLVEDVRHVRHGQVLVEHPPLLEHEDELGSVETRERFHRTRALLVRLSKECFLCVRVYVTNVFIWESTRQMYVYGNGFCVRACDICIYIYGTHGVCLCVSKIWSKFMATIKPTF